MAKLKIKAQVRGGHLKNWSDESIIGMSMPPNAEEALVKKKKNIYMKFSCTCTSVLKQNIVH